MRWSISAMLLGLSWMIVGVWRIGPVLLVLSPTHGVHSGDGLAAVPMMLAFGLMVAPLVTTPRRRVHA
jgi:hypothetical protein